MTDDARKILIVDDERRYVEAHARMLEDTYDVRTAVGGEAALEAAAAGIDVIVVDRKMPTISGEELLERLRDRGIACGAVMLTAVEPNVDIVDIDVDDYLTKPVTEAELKSSIAGVLEVLESKAPMRDYFSLSNKRDVLLEEQADLPGTEAFEEIEQQLIATAERNLQQSKEALEALIQSSPVAIVTLDREGMVDLWNSRAELLFGWSASAVTGTPPPMFSGDTDTQLEMIREQLFRGSSVTDMNVECVTESGSRLTVSLSAAPLYDGAEEMDGVMFVLEDITERKQRRQRISVLNRLLRHNLRNDLNVVIGNLSFLRDSLSDTEQEHVDVALNHLRGLLSKSEKARSVQDILSPGAETLERQDIEKLIERVQTKLTTLDSDATVELSVETPLTTVRASPGLEKAVWELVENAVTHTDRAEPHVQITIDRQATAEREWVRITVADDGPGIPERELAVLEEATESALEHGSGIGLWIVKWVVDQSGGTLSFSEGDCGGTRATISLAPAEPRSNASS